MRPVGSRPASRDSRCQAEHAPTILHHTPGPSRMKSLNARQRIIATFAAIIATMIVLGAISYNRLGAIEREATGIETDDLPGVLVSAEASALAKDILSAVLTRSTSTDPQMRQRAAQAVEDVLTKETRLDSAFERTVTTDSERQPFAAMVNARGQFVRVYRVAVADNTLTENEVNTQLRPEIERYVTATDTLVALSRREGVAAATRIRSAVQTSKSTLEIGIAVAALISIIFAWLLL